MENKYRYLLIQIIVYICGIVIISSLFNIQVLKGLEYRKKSSARLVRELDIEPVRGKIYDRSGKILADSKVYYQINIFKNNLDRQRLNKLINVFSKILEKNQEKFDSILPIAYPYEFTLNSEEEKKWKKENGLPQEATPKECINRLKEVYGIDENDEVSLYNQVSLKYTILNTPNSLESPVKIASGIKRETVLQILEKQQDMPGLKVSPTSIREYTSNNLASHVLGYIGRVTNKDIEKGEDYIQKDIIGKTGIESYFEKLLRGKRGKKLIEIDIDGNILNERDIQKTEGGSDVILTIESNLQKTLEDSLKRYIEKMKSGEIANRSIDAKAASAVVMNIHTGEILAMANYPDYNPQDFVGGISQKNWEKYNIATSPLLNRATEGTYAPGSTFKMISAVAGLESGKITTKEKINDTGVYPAPHRPECWIYTDYKRGHGWLNVVGALAQSCNYFFYEVGNRVGPEIIAQYAKQFGLGEKTNVEIEEEKGEVASPQTAAKYGEKWDIGGTLSLPIGQSYTKVTPIQLCKYVATLANRGNIVNPTLVKEIVSADGTKSDFKKENKKEKIQINEENLNAVLDGMRAVVSPGGSAQRSFADFKVKIAGKTGSAEAGENVNALFVGYAPFDNPEIAFAIVVENGRAGHYLAYVVKDILAAYKGDNIEKITENMDIIEKQDVIR